MLIAETLRIPAQEAAQAYVDSGTLAGHATRDYAEQAADARECATNILTMLACSCKILAERDAAAIQGSLGTIARR